MSEHTPLTEAERDVSPEPMFGMPIGCWFRWFAWHPTKTTDRGWRWMRPVWRRRYQTKPYLDGPTLTWFLTNVGDPRCERAPLPWTVSRADALTILDATAAPTTDTGARDE